MLPTVPATSAYLVQLNQRQASPSQAESEHVASSLAVATVPRTMPLGTTSSLELLDLSGQMRLSQSLSVFAETLGNFLKLPRRDGEALADYSKRLASAMAALGDAERTRLQARLNQIMQGATLRLLAELLKDPAGPAAARLAVQIEIGQYRERDLAARQVVSSYRQNNGSETAALPANRNAAQEQHGDADTDTPRPAPAASGRDAEGTGKEAPLTTDAQPDETARAQAADDTPSRLARSNDAATASPEEPAGKNVAQKSDNDEISLAHSDDQSADANTSDAGVDKTVLAPGDPDGDGESVSRPEPAPARASTAGSSSGSSPSTGRAAMATAPALATIYDAAALARLVQGEAGLAEGPTTGTLVNLFVAEWVSELLFAEPKAREARHAVLSGSAATPVPGNDGEKPQTADGSQSELTRPLSSSSKTSEAQVQGPQTQQQSASSTAIAMQIRGATMEGKDLQQTLFAPSLQNRHAIAQAFVPYAPVNDFETSESHEVKRKSATDGEGQSQRDGGYGQSSGDEEPEAGQEQQPEPTAEDGVSEETPPSQIAALGDLPALPHAVRQPLARDLLPGAEDFYRRLAGGE